MVRLEELEALDLLVWLQNSITVPGLVGSNQSTICRRAQRCLEAFQGRLARGRNVWSVETPLEPLLDLQRQIHQSWRFIAGRGLRLNIPFWSRQPLRGAIPDGWLVNPDNGPIVCENPLQLLRGQMIDAAVVTPTQVCGQDLNDLVCIDLYQSMIDLHRIHPEGGAPPVESWRVHGTDLTARSCLDPMPFLPGSCWNASRERFEDLRRQLGLTAKDSPDEAGAALEGSNHLAFLTPVMAAVLDATRPLEMDLHWPYREMLVLSRRTADQPAAQALVEKLQMELPRRLQQMVPGMLLGPA